MIVAMIGIAQYVIANQARKAAKIRENMQG
jgi:hypothetical protein